MQPTQAILAARASAAAAGNTAKAEPNPPLRRLGVPNTRANLTGWKFALERETIGIKTLKGLSRFRLARQSLELMLTKCVRHVMTLFLTTIISFSRQIKVLHFQGLGFSA